MQLQNAKSRLTGTVMKKILRVHIGNDLCEIELPDKDKSVFIVGADSYYGRNFAEHWKQHGYTVYGCGSKKFNTAGILDNYYVTDYSAWKIPDIKFAWLLICHDAQNGFEDHFRVIKNLCESLLQEERSINIVYLSSSLIYDSSSKSIKENYRIVPHNQYEMTIATAENCLHEYSFRSKGKLLPYILRCGDVYGDLIKGVPYPSLVSKYFSMVQNMDHLFVPGMGASERTLHHISDVCESSIAFLNSDFPPRCVNLPGEKISVVEIAVSFSRKYNMEIYMVDSTEVDNEKFGDFYTPYSGNRWTSSHLFKKVVKFTPRYKFRTWFRTVQEAKHA